ncbi:MAG: hypothetical protein ACH37Z_10515 [Anaerolineae bacterium]
MLRIISPVVIGRQHRPLAYQFHGRIPQDSGHVAVGKVRPDGTEHQACGIARRMKPPIITASPVPTWQRMGRLTRLPEPPTSAKGTVWAPSLQSK